MNVLIGALYGHLALAAFIFFIEGCFLAYRACSSPAVAVDEHDPTFMSWDGPLSPAEYELSDNVDGVKLTDKQVYIPAESTKASMLPPTLASRIIDVVDRPASPPKDRSVLTESDRVTPARTARALARIEKKKQETTNLEIIQTH